MSTMILRAPKGATKKKRIVGRGESSGHGKTSGRGSNGQKSRSGGSVRPGFEGGQMPLFRRVAARGFSNEPFKEVFVAINLSILEKVYENGETVNLDTLVAKGVTKKGEIAVKILGNGELTKKLTVEIPFMSQSASEKIKKAGGSVPELNKTSSQSE